MGDRDLPPLLDLTDRSAASGPRFAPKPSRFAVLRAKLTRNADAPTNPLWRWLAIGVSLLIISLALFILTRTLASLNYAQVRSAFAKVELRQILLAYAATSVSYLALMGYDAVALRQMRIKIPFRITALGSFTAYSISFVLGFPLITGGTVRYWIYSRQGLSAGKVASLTLIASITFWLGMALVIGMALILKPDAIAEIDHLSTTLNFSLGIFVLAMILAYLGWVSAGRRRMRIQRLKLELPGFVLTMCQITLGLIDLCSASAALYFLLPEGHQMDYVLFVALYVFACLLGIASNAPGGIGVFEVTMLKIVTAPPQEAVLASLLLFRIVYYLSPFLLALALLGANEAVIRWRSLREAMVNRSEDDE